MEAYFNTIFEDVCHERSLFLLLSSVEPDILRQTKFLDHEIEIIRNIALEKLHRRRNLKEITALEVIEKQFSDQSKKMGKQFFSSLIFDDLSKFK